MFVPSHLARSDQPHGLRHSHGLPLNHCQWSAQAKEYRNNSWENCLASVLRRVSPGLGQLAFQPAGTIAGRCHVHRLGKLAQVFPEAWLSHVPKQADMPGMLKRLTKVVRCIQSMWPDVNSP
jgi:hypothetical protein